MSQREKDEAALIEWAKSDLGGFGELYERYVDRIYNYIFYRVGNHHDVEDLTARTFQRALEHVGRYEDRGAPFSAWLYRIAHNLIANWHRDSSRRPVVALDESVTRNLTEPHPEMVAESQDDTRLLREAIRGLHAARQQLLVLKFTEGLSNVEIGNIMGRSEGAIKSLYHRTLLQLRKEMSKRGLSVE